jgi:hypothetical protein
MKVMIGTSRNRQTSKSFLVCSSMPPWRHWGRRPTPSPRCRPRQGAGGVLTEILVVPRVEQVEGKRPCSKLITVADPEMLRSRSTAIQS